MTRSSTGRHVSCDASPFNLHAGSVIDVFEMAPEVALAVAAGDTEFSFGAGRCAGNPPATGHEVLAITRWGEHDQRSDQGHRSGYKRIRNPGGRHVKSVHADASVLALNGTDLLIEDYL